MCHNDDHQKLGGSGGGKKLDAHRRYPVRPFRAGTRPHSEGGAQDRRSRRRRKHRASPSQRSHPVPHIGPLVLGLAVAPHANCLVFYGENATLQEKPGSTGTTSLASGVGSIDSVSVRVLPIKRPEPGRLGAGDAPACPKTPSTLK